MKCTRSHITTLAKFFPDCTVELTADGLTLSSTACQYGEECLRILSEKGEDAARAWLAEQPHMGHVLMMAPPLEVELVSDAHFWLSQWEAAAEMGDETGEYDECELLVQELYDVSEYPSMEDIDGKALFLMPDGSVISADDDAGEHDGWQAHTNVDAAVKELDGDDGEDD